MLTLWLVLLKVLLWDVLLKPQSHGADLSISATKTAVFFQNNSSISPDFGIRPEYSWPSILSNISEWNRNTKDDIYRLVVVGRHGQGVHNIAEIKYGTNAWNNKWSKLNGDGVLYWGPDANLTKFGEQQAKLVQRLWSSQKHLPRPAVKYSSPLSRALKTATITFENDKVKSSIYVLENLRETIGMHTCDRRSRLSQTLERFPNVVFEPHATEEDILWKPDSREDDKHTRDRARSVLQHIMLSECQIKKHHTPKYASGPNTERVISVTTHSGFIRNLLDELVLPSVRVETGAIVSLVLHTSCLGLN